jgi:hypothetical protein
MPKALKLIYKYDWFCTSMPKGRSGGYAGDAGAKKKKFTKNKFRQHLPREW